VTKIGHRRRRARLGNPVRTLEVMLEGLFQPMHLLVLFFFVVVCGVGFVVLRLLWRAGTKLGKVTSSAGDGSTGKPERKRTRLALR